MKIRILFVYMCIIRPALLFLPIRGQQSHSEKHHPTENQHLKLPNIKKPFQLTRDI